MISQIRVPATMTIEAQSVVCSLWRKRILNTGHLIGNSGIWQWSGPEQRGCAKNQTYLVPPSFEDGGWCKKTQKGLELVEEQP
jgi:hypothetical protein